MNSKLYYLFGLLFMGLLITSCTKEASELSQIEEDGEVANVSAYEYFIDGIAVATLDRTDSNYEIAVVGKVDPADANSVIEQVFAFTNDEDYLRWGKDNGFNVKGALDAQQFTRQLSEQHNMGEIYAQTGEIPDWYTQEVVDFLTASSSAVERVLNLNIRYGLDNCWRSTRFMPVAVSNMGSENNRMTRIRNLYTANTFVTLYDNGNWSNHLETVYYWPFRSRCLPSGIRNRTNSFYRTP